MYLRIRFSQVVFTVFFPSVQFLKFIRRDGITIKAIAKHFSNQTLKKLAPTLLSLFIRDYC